MSKLGLGSDENVAKVFAAGRKAVKETHGSMFGAFDRIAAEEHKLAVKRPQRKDVSRTKGTQKMSGP